MVTESVPATEPPTKPTVLELGRSYIESTGLLDTIQGEITASAAGVVVIEKVLGNRITIGVADSETRSNTGTRINGLVVSSNYWRLINFLSSNRSALRTPSLTIRSING